VIQYDTRNWLGLLTRVHGTVLPRIALRVLVTAAIAVGVTALAREHVIDLSIPASVHTLVGVALGLLLVFRTNASYDRFWEGRRMLGSTINDLRDLGRQTAAWLPREAAARQANLLVVWFATIRRYLRNEREWPELEALLGADQHKAIAATRCPPVLVARWLSEGYAAEANAGRLTEQRLQLLDTNLQNIIDWFGGAERIMKTPVPFAYAHHIKGFLTIFCFTVPLALLAQLGWYTAPAAAIVAYAMFGIDEIGVEIEDPFGYDPNDLPLDAMQETITTDVTQAVS
jgi:putative membrane protein